MLETVGSAAANRRPASDTPGGGYLAALNADQRLAVEHGVGQSCVDDRGPLLIIAGAGSGKTNTLAHRVAHLLLNGADPQRILLLTFSCRAAAEMERRCASLLQRLVAARHARQQAPALPWAGTFHSVGARLLRELAPRIGLDESFTILDRGDAEDLLALARHELGFDKTERRFPTKATCLAIYSRAINGGTALADVLEDAYPWCARWATELASLFDAYVAMKQAQRLLDYDDLLLYWAEMVAEPRLAQDIGERFDHILVDEYQDTNRLQATILKAMRPDGRGVTVVGDDAQSIYSFRAATIRNILDFPGQYAPPARVVTLERNYRSTQPLLEASNAVIGLAAQRYAKNLWSERVSSRKPELVSVRDEAAQACCVAERVLDQREKGVALKSQAVLFRSSSHSAQLEIELVRRDIPFVKYGGLKFLETAHVKDVLGILRWAQNPRNRIAGFRVLRMLPGIGPATAARLLDAVSAAANPMSALEGFTPPQGAAADWSGFLAVCRALREPSADWPTELECVVRWYEPHLLRLYDDASIRQSDLLELLRIASTYSSREQFLTDMTLDPPDATSDHAGIPGRDDDFLILSTIHSAKGQEWKAVYVLNVVDGCIPSDMGTGTTEEIEEERRLLYVAMTRAKDDLSLIVPQRFYVHQQSARGDRHVYATRSRFIPDTLTALFEPQAWPLATNAETSEARASEPLPSVDLAARVRALWR